MNRQQRRQLERETNKLNNLANLSSNLTNNNLTDISKQKEEVDTKIKDIINDLTKLFEYNKKIDFKVNLIIDTLHRLKISSYEEILTTESFYKKKPEIKEKKIKNIFKMDLDARETLNAVRESKDTPNYLKLYIDPIKDLNLNPYEVAQIIREDFPELSLMDHIGIGESMYNLKAYHFGVGEEPHV